jgi:hypothetical protein
MTIPVATDQLRVDYYAGLIAVLAVILFAKFVAHRGKSQQDAKASSDWHLLCVVLAGLGAIGCLGVLGWAKPNGVEAWLRGIVGVLTLLAAGILLYDLTLGRGQKARD